MLGVVCVVVLVTIPFTKGISQIQPNGGSPGPGRTNQGFTALPENANPHPDGVRILKDSMQTEENLKRIRELNIIRQKEMTTDSQKLLILANQLKAETEKANKETLWMLEVRKAEQIEKLAHAVREKMRATVTAD